MRNYIIRRVLATIPVALLVGIVAFMLIHLTPGDPAQFFVDADAPPGEVARVRERLGLDRPIPVQFVEWFSGVLRGDLGVSFFRNQPVIHMFRRAFPASAMLTVSSLLLAVITGIPIGVISAIKQNTWIDKIVTGFVLLGVAMPNFWLGLLLIVGFAVTLGWLPAQGFVRPEQGLVESLRHLILPSIALGFSGAALIARMTRSSMLEVLRQDYIRTARSKGLRDRMIHYKHALSNAFNPILTVIGLTVVSLISGNLVVELVFNYPGVGRLVIDSVFRRDYPVIQGSLLLIAAITIIINLLVDLLYAYTDPRIRYE